MKPKVFRRVYDVEFEKICLKQELGNEYIEQAPGKYASPRALEQLHSLSPLETNSFRKTINGI
ncbi:MAG: hypothetical protein CL666_12080 [Balneola sp.]|nr:hypothetical protein [Balneola sp.]